MMEFRVIIEEGPQEQILAGEEALLQSVAEGEKPILRFVIFNPTAVLIGYHQAIEQEVNVEEVRKLGWDLGRRPTGGGAIIMGKGQLGWEIYADLSILGPPEDAIRKGAFGVIKTLEKFGLRANFRPKNDVEINGKKISGIGAFSEGKYIAVTGTLLIDFDVDTMIKVLKVTTEKLKDKVAKDLKERLTWLNKELGHSVEINDVIRAAKKGFSEALGVNLRESVYTKKEEDLINTLKLKYSSPEWIYGLRKPLEGTNVRYTEKKFQGGLVRVQVKLLENKIIESVFISGDFFIEPKRAIYDLEARLKWSRIENIEEEIREWYKNVKIIGISADDLISLIREVLNK
ncbi:MAG: biotin/lipoate A/B protein ligase family protein [Sulfolobaceae archaeon]